MGGHCRLTDKFAGLREPDFAVAFWRPDTDPLINPSLWPARSTMTLHWFMNTAFPMRPVAGYGYIHHDPACPRSFRTAAERLVWHTIKDRLIGPEIQLHQRTPLETVDNSVNRQHRLFDDPVADRH
jgi:hypothetical protein